MAKVLGYCPLLIEDNNKLQKSFKVRCSMKHGGCTVSTQECFLVVNHSKLVPPLSQYFKMHTLQMKLMARPNSCLAIELYLGIGMDEKWEDIYISKHPLDPYM